METKEKKKIGLIGALLMGIGCIVGSGIFGTLPTVIAEYGSGVIWALLGAAFVVVLRSLSLMYTSAAIPSSAAQFMWAAKLIDVYKRQPPNICMRERLSPSRITEKMTADSGSK